MSVSVPRSSAAATPEAPWLGLRPFTEDAQEYFFGRKEELDELSDRILGRPLTILFGTSGLGKSSLLQAALMPRLRAEGFLPVHVRFDHDPTAPSLEAQLLDRLAHALAEGDFPVQAQAASATRDGTMDPSAALWLLFHDPLQGFAAPIEGVQPRPVVLIDQFEEIFTLGEQPKRREINATLRESLATLIENRPPAALRAQLEADDELADRVDYRAQPLRVLLSLREDFLHILERWRRSMPSLMENRLELRMLSGPQALEAVVQPGQRREGQLAIIPDEVGRAIVRFVAGVGEEVPLEEIDAVPPLLSLVCAELNAQRIAAGDAQITRTQFEVGRDDILKSFYERSFDPASYGGLLGDQSDGKSALGSLRNLIEAKLLSSDGFRENIAFDTIQRDLSQIIGSETSRIVLDAIVERRVLTVEERGGVRRLELAHDVLTRIVKASRDERQEKEAVASAQREKEHAESETKRIRNERNQLRRFAIAAAVCALVAFVTALAAFSFFVQGKHTQEALYLERVKSQRQVEQLESLRLREDSSAHELANLQHYAIEHGNMDVLARTSVQLESLSRASTSQNNDQGSQLIAKTIFDGRLALSNAMGRVPEAIAIMRKEIERLERTPLEDIQSRCDLLSAYLKLASTIGFESGHQEPWKNAAPLLLKAKTLSADLQQRASKNLKVEAATARMWVLSAKYSSKESTQTASEAQDAMALLSDSKAKDSERYTNLKASAVYSLKEADDDYQKALAIIRGKSEQAKNEPEFSEAVSSTLWNYGDYLKDNGKYDDAIKLFEEDLQHNQEVLRNDFANQNARLYTALDLREIGKTYENQRRSSDAINYFKQALDVTTEMIKMAPDGTDGWWENWTEHQNLANSLRTAADQEKGKTSPDQIKDLEEIWTHRRLEIEAARHLLKTEPNSLRWKSLLFDSLDDFCWSTDRCLDALREKREISKLLAYAKEAALVAREEFQDHRQEITTRSQRVNLIDAYLAIGQGFAATDQNNEARLAYEATMQACQLLPDKKMCLFEDNRGPAELGLALLCESEKKHQEMLQHLEAGTHFDPCKTVFDKLADVYSKGIGVSIDLAKASVYLEQAKQRSVKTFIIPMPVGPTEKVPVNLYIGREFADGRTPLDDCNLQLEFLRERGVYLPPDVNASIKKLYDIAVENKVAFVDLLTYALNYKDEKDAKSDADKLPAPPDLDEDLRDVEIARSKLANDSSDKNKFALASELGGAAFAAIFVKRFEDAITWSNEALRLIASTNPSYDPKERASLVFVYGNLAHALLFTGKFDEALKIYRKYWDKPLSGRSFKDAVIEDFARFDKAGLTHPDLPRMKKALGIPPTSK